MLAYSNGSGRQRSLVIYHTRFGSTSGTIRTSAKYAVKGGDGSKRVVRRSLAQGLGLPNDPGAFTAFRDARTGLEYLRSSKDLWEHGLAVSLDAYATNVFWEFRDIWDGVSGQWARLAARLAGAGVQSLDDALRELQLEPIHGPFRAIFADGLTVAVLDGVATSAQLDELERRVVAFLSAVAEATGVDGDPAGIAKRIRARAERAFVGMAVSAEDAGFAAAAALLRGPDPAPPSPTTKTVPSGATGSDDAIARRSSRGSRSARPAAWHPAPMSPQRAWPGTTSSACRAHSWPASTTWASARARHGRSPTTSVSCWPCRGHRGCVARLASSRHACSRRGWPRETTRIAIGLNTWEGVEYLDRDRLRDLLSWAVRLDAIDAPDDRTAAASIRAAVRLADAAEAAGYRVDRLRAELAAAPRKAATAKAKAPKARRPRAPRRPRSDEPPGDPYPRRIRRRSDVGGVPWASTDSRCGR